MKKKSSAFNKKLFVSISLMFLISIFLVNLTLAQGSGNSAGLSKVVKNLNEGIDGILTEAEPLIRTLFGDGVDGAPLTGEELFAKVLFFTVIFCIIWLSMDQVPLFHDRGGYLFFISIAASLLSVRYLASPQILAILMPYEALGITLSAALPFVIFFIIVNMGLKEQPAAVRKVAWIFFSVVMFGVYLTRLDKVNDENLYWVNMYLFTSILSLIMLLVDGTIQRWWKKISMDKDLMASDYVIYSELLKERKLLQDALTTARLSTGGKSNAMITKLKDRLKGLETQLHELRTRKIG